MTAPTIDLSVPGDAAAVDTAAAALRDRAGALERTGAALRDERVAGWQGAAADAFHQRISVESPRWLRAADTMHAAAAALTAHAATLRWGQAQTGVASALDPAAAPAFIGRVRAQVAESAARAARAIAEGAALAPTGPTFTTGVQLADVLDLPITNPDGELAGGVNPDLPLDLAQLQALLDQARAAHVDPHRYAALLQQYWLVKAANDAGIDLASWDPGKGVGPNNDTIVAVYRFYGKLALEHPELQWAGMASMIGPSFAAGFQDLDGMREFAKRLGQAMAIVPADQRAKLFPPGAAELASVGATLTSAEMSWFENTFLAMQKHIFIDMATQHEAYLSGDPRQLDEMRDAGLIDPKARRAWEQIASGNPEDVSKGNAQLLYREQNEIIDKQYRQMYDHDGPVGKAVTYGMTVAGSASIPNTRTPGEYSPLHVVLNDVPAAPSPLPLPGLPAPASVDIDVSTPLPDFNIADKDHRWAYVSGDTLPAYQELLRDHPDQARDIIGSPVEDRVAEQRLGERWPELVRDLAGHWDVSVRDPRIFGLPVG